jgi:hypothetical protein
VGTLHHADVVPIDPVCGCTDRHPCNPPCHRVKEDLCSTCLEAAQAVLYWRQSALKPDRNALWME